MLRFAEISDLEAVKVAESSVEKGNDFWRNWIRNVLQDRIAIEVDQFVEVSTLRVDLDSVGPKHCQNVRPGLCAVPSAGANPHAGIAVADR